MEPEPKGPARKPARRKTSKQTIAELKDILQRRVEVLNAEIGRLGAEAQGISTEREGRALGMVTRTLNSVLQMERKEREHRTAKSRQRRVVNAARRAELARRIVALGAGPRPSGGDGGPDEDAA